jgi:hypothetical protein
VKRASAVLLAFTALTLARFDPVMADGFYRQHRHPTYTEPDLTYDSVCSVGWWQTLRYGHVRPYWGIRCLKVGRRRHID